MLTSPPPMTQFGADLYAALEPIAGPDADLGYPLAVICGAFGELFRDVEEIARAQPGREPYQQAFDIGSCPDFNLPWLGQVVGVRDINGLTSDQQRAKIIAEAGFYRGSGAAMKAAVAATLTGTMRVRLLERVSDAWTMTLVTDPGETPDPALTGRTAEAAKVAMNLLTVLQSSVPLFEEGTRTFAAATGTFATATLANVT